MKLNNVYTATFISVCFSRVLAEHEVPLKHFPHLFKVHKPVLRVRHRKLSHFGLSVCLIPFLSFLNFIVSIPVTAI